MTALRCPQSRYVSRILSPHADVPRLDRPSPDLEDTGTPVQSFATEIAVFNGGFSHHGRFRNESLALREYSEVASKSPFPSFEPTVPRRICTITSHSMPTPHIIPTVMSQSDKANIVQRILAAYNARRYESTNGIVGIRTAFVCVEHTMRQRRPNEQGDTKV